MRIVARNQGIMDGILRCADCDMSMVQVGAKYLCLQKVEPEELVAVGLIPSRDSNGKLAFESTAKDRQWLQASQAYTNTVEVDGSYLEKLGLNLEKIRRYELKHGLVP